MHGIHPQNGIPDFSLHFPKEGSNGYLRFEGKKFAQLAVSVLLIFGVGRHASFPQKPVVKIN